MTNPATPLPSSLISRYHGWRATSFQENRSDGMQGLQKAASTQEL